MDRCSPVVKLLTWVTLPIQSCNSGLRLYFSVSMIFPSILLRARIAQKATPRFHSFLSYHPPRFSPSQIQCRRFIGRFFRPGPKALQKTETPGVKRVYGERVLVYYAGQKIVFVATLKLATLFVFFFCTFIAAPSVGIDTEYGYWAPIGSQFLFTYNLSANWKQLMAVA